MIALPLFNIQLIPPLLGDCPLRFDPNSISNFLTYASQCSAAIKTLIDYKTGLEIEWVGGLGHNDLNIKLCRSFSLT